MIQIYGWKGADLFFAAQARAQEAGGIISSYRERGWRVFWRRL